MIVKVDVKDIAAPSEELISAALEEPVYVQRDGDTVAVLLSPHWYKMLLEMSRRPGTPNPKVMEAARENLRKYESVYRALTEWEQTHDRLPDQS